MNTVVSVTQQQIDQGIPADPERCAVALAVAEALGDGRTPHLYAGGRLVITPALPRDDPFAGRVTLNIPQPAARLAWRADHHLPVAPLVFHLDVPAADPPST